MAVFKLFIHLLSDQGDCRSIMDEPESLVMSCVAYEAVLGALPQRTKHERQGEDRQEVGEARLHCAMPPLASVRSGRSAGYVLISMVAAGYHAPLRSRR